MSLQNEMRRTEKTNLEYVVRRLRGEIENLCTMISLNLDCGLKLAEHLPIDVVDGQWDDLKAKWAELTSARAKIERLEAELK